MGKKAVKQYFHIILLVASIILLIFTIIGLYGGDVTPVGNNLRALTTMALPVFLPLNLVTFIYWLIRRSWFASIPALAMLCASNYFSSIYQFGSRPENVHSDLTVATYNVHSFSKDGSGVIAADIINSLKKEGADIVCMQEFDNTMSGDQHTIYDKIRDYYPYKSLHNSLVILSKYPILKKQNITFEMTNNAGMWADIDVKGKTIRVFNVHMETTGINSTLSHASQQNTSGDDDPILPQNQQLARNLFDNYMFNSEVRSGQAITIANEKHNTQSPIILCGDFNDVPYSFTYNTLLGDLKDGFREGGHGYSATYRGAKGFFRIDYIFHSEGMKSVDYYTVDHDYSDHYPVFSRIVFENAQ